MYNRPNYKSVHNLICRKGTRVICPKCGRHCLTFTKDYYQSEALLESDFEKNGFMKNISKCPNCDADLFKYSRPFAIQWEEE